MKNGILLAVAVLFLSGVVNGQVNFEWAKRMGGTGNSGGFFSLLDSAGNIYTVGTFRDTVDFDPGVGIFNLTSAGLDDIFVSKLDASGTFVWAKQLGGTSNEGGCTATIDAAGNIYVTGGFRGTADFDPGIGTINFTSAGNIDIFICKLDPMGQIVWAKHIGGSSTDQGIGIEVDVLGNVHVTGQFSTTADFDPGVGVYNLTSGGNVDAFISKLDANGNFVWAKRMGSSGSSEVQNGASIRVDVMGNVYTIGSFEGIVDFDPGVGVFNLTCVGTYGNAFISKLDASGNFVWAKQIAGFYLFGRYIELDILGNIFLTGTFENTADFDPGPGVFNLTSAGDFDVYICKLDINGNFVWAKNMGGPGADSGHSILDSDGNIYSTGYFNGTADFDPSPAVYNLTADGLSDVFVSKLDVNGNFIWAERIGGPGASNAFSVLDKTGNIYTSGYFSGTVDFDIGTGVFNLTSAGGNDIFILKLNQKGVLGSIYQDFNSNCFQDMNDTDFSNRTLVINPGNITVTANSNGVWTLDSLPSGNYTLTADTSGNWLPTCPIVQNFTVVHPDSITNAPDFGFISGNNPPILTGIDSTNNYTITIWSDSSICFDVHSIDTNGNIITNMGFFNTPLSGATFIPTLGNDTVVGTFCWTPNSNDIGTHNVQIYAQDNGLPISAQTVKTYTISVVPNYVFGYVYRDFNGNCVQNAIDTVLANRLLMINPGNLIVTTNNSGFWELDSLPAGNYTITIDTTGSWIPTCPITQSFTVVHSDSITSAPSFGFLPTPCPLPNISIHTSILRPGFSNQVYVQACNGNLGTSVLSNAYAIVELDPLFTVDTSSLPYINLGNNQYRINLGTISTGQCVIFWLSCTLSSTAVLGQTLCVNAKLYPVTPCVLDAIPNPYPMGFTPCNTPYDQSHLEIDAFCNNNSINFRIINTGSSNMSCFAPVRLYINGIYMQLDSIQLPSGDTAVFSYDADGRTWRMEVNQHPLHPGNSNPSATIERCGNAANWTPNLVSILPHDDADPIIDIHCRMVTGSYDPNDKTGYPLGVGSNHDIEPNQNMEYVIRFQNTGTDTAFTVVIRDTLSMDLDVFSVRSGASSHDYSFRMYGPRVLEWTFNNIMLPDSNVNLIGSNGFVTFKVRQVPNLPVGTVIENSASIYFDFNAPIFTNTSWHTIDLPQDLNWDGVQTLNVAACENYSFNNLGYDNSGTYWQVVQNGALDSLYTLNLTIDEIPSDSITLSGTTLTAYTPNISYQWLDCNNGNTPIAGETNQSFTPLMNGNYAVEMTDGTCTIVSNCMNVTGVVVEKLVNDLGILIYPNPTTGILHLEKGNNSEISIEVLDNLGRVLLVQSSNDLITNVNLSYLPTGVYYVSISDGEQIVKEKIVKQ